MNNKENNILIAEFMGKEIYHKHHESFYDVSWSWLMPVIQKIEDMKYCTIIGKGHFYWCSIFISINKNGERKDVISREGNASTTKIEITYKVVVEFIKIYNKDKGK